MNIEMDRISTYLESLFHHKGYKCVIIFTGLGHRCGYVGVDRNHPLFGIEYNRDIKSEELLQELKNSAIGKRGIVEAFCWDGKEIRPSLLFNVHGSLTYSGSNKTYPTNQFDPLWWFGFDCAHAGDARDYEELKKREPTNKWYKIYEIEKKYPIRNDMIRTKEYVEDECRSLADQLDCVGELLKQTRLMITP